MTDYQEARRQHLLNRAPLPPPPVAASHRYERPNIEWRRTYYIGAQARQKLRAKAARGERWISATINAIVAANPTIHEWRDTRPDDLRAQDADRLGHGKLPLWSYGDDNGRAPGAKLTLTLTPEVRFILSEVSWHYGIGAASYTAGMRGFAGKEVWYEGIRTIKLDTLDTRGEWCRVGYALRAWGVGYLTPIITPAPIIRKNVNERR